MTIPKIAILAAYLSAAIVSTGVAQTYDTDDNAEDPFDSVRDTAYLCRDTGDSVLLSKDVRPEASACRNYYVECEGDRCMSVIFGAREDYSKQQLLQFGADVLAVLGEDRAQAAVPGLPIPGGGIGPGMAGFADPYCMFYQSMGQPCPDAPGGGLPGTPSNPSSPFPPGQNNNCYLCTAKYIPCFASAGINLIQQGICIAELKECAKKRYG